MTKSRGIYRPRVIPPEPVTLDWLLSQAAPAANGCLEWRHGRTAGGYGTVRYRGRRQYVHRLVCALVHGDPDGREVLHGCDNPPCIAPVHLSWNTHRRNMADAIDRGLYSAPSPRYGTRHHSSKLTYAIAEDLRRRYAAGESQSALARELGLHQSSVWAVVHNKTWTVNQ